MIAADRRRDFAAALFVLALGIGFLAWAQTFPPRATAMPKLVGWLMVFLALVDCASQTNSRLGLFLRKFSTAQEVIEWKAQGDGENASPARVILAMAWVFFYLGGVLLVGFLLMTPVYVLLYMLVHGRKSLLMSACAAAVTTLLIWITFEQLFRYPLYRGILFGAY